MVVKIIKYKTEGILEWYAIEMEALGMDKNNIYLLSRYPSQNSTRRNSANIQKHNCQGDIPKVSPDKKSY